MLVFHIIIFLINLGSSKTEERINSEQASINDRKMSGTRAEKQTSF